MRIIIGTFQILLGLLGIGISTLTIQSDLFHRRYTYNGELTEHELIMLIIFIISFILIISGIITIIAAILKNKSYNKLQQLLNQQNLEYLKNQCPNCKLNVAENTEICPRCNYKLKQE